MKKPLTIVLTVALIAAVIVSCVFGTRNANLKKAAEEQRIQLEETEANRAELEQQLNATREDAEAARAELEQQLSETEAARAELEKQLGETHTSAESLQTELEGRIAELEGRIAELNDTLTETRTQLVRTERALAASRCNACLIYASSDWSVTNWGTADSEDGKVKVTPANVIGEGDYTVGLEFAEPVNGLNLGGISIENGEMDYPGAFVRLNAVRVNGQSVPFGVGYTTTTDGKNTRLYLYREWNGEDEEKRCYDGNTAEASSIIVDRAAFEDVKTLEADFSVLTAPIDSAAILFSNADGSVQNLDKENRAGLGVQTETTEIRGPGSGYRVSLVFAEPVHDLSLLALAVRRGEVTFPGYGLMITRLWADDQRIAPLEGLKGYTSSDDGIETRMNLYNQGVGELPEDARSLTGDLENAAAVWVNPADFEGARRIEIEFSYRPVPEEEKKEITVESAEAANTETGTEAAQQEAGSIETDAEAMEQEAGSTETGTEAAEQEASIAETGTETADPAAEADGTETETESPAAETP